MSVPGNLKKRQRPSGKWMAAGIVVFVFAAVAVCLSLVWISRNQNSSSASLPQMDPNRVEGVAGGEGTEAYNQTLKQYGEEQAQQAQERGQSHISPVGGGSTAPVDLMLTEVAATTPQNPPPQPMGTPAVDVAPYQAVINAEEAARRKEEQMQASIAEALNAIAKRSALTGHSNVTFDEPKKPTSEQSAAAGTPGATGTAQTPAASAGQTDKPALPVKLGEALYAVIDQVLNSDHPAPSFRATIIAGPAEGYRAFGKFDRKEDVMVLSFGRLISPSGVAYDIDGYGIDPASSEVAFASNVNYHTLAKTGAIITLTGAKFIEGFGEAISRSGSVTTTVGTGGSTEVAKNKDFNTNELAWQAAGSSAGVLAGIAEKVAENTLNRPPTVRLNAGETVGIVILGIK